MDRKIYSRSKTSLPNFRLNPQLIKTQGQSSRSNTSAPRPKNPHSRKKKKNQPRTIAPQNRLKSLSHTAFALVSETTAGQFFSPSRKPADRFPGSFFIRESVERLYHGSSSRRERAFNEPIVKFDMTRRRRSFRFHARKGHAAWLMAMPRHSHSPRRDARKASISPNFPLGAQRAIFRQGGGPRRVRHASSNHLRTHTRARRRVTGNLPLPPSATYA